MKIAIATNDKETVPRGHFGQARYFCVADLQNGQPFTEDCRASPTVGDHGRHKSDRILALLDDCDVLVGRAFGVGGFRRGARQGKQVFLTSAERIEEVVDDINLGEMHRFKQFDPATGRFVEFK